ncbi:hypothetical protein C0989_006444 [Termitomyces sp. Mn162]|nr:hypothetical protein C0989_006444 [Termitomyces sp. Mn162]
MQGTLGINDNLQNKLRALVKEIHTSPNPRPFEDPLDPARSFHVQCKEPVGTQNEAPSSIPRQQEELNMASSILRNLNPTGGLFNQPATHTLALSAWPWASSVPSTFQTWDQPAAPELCNPTNEHAPRNGPQQDQPPHFDLHAPHINAPPPRPNAPVSPQQPMGPGASRPPFSTNPSHPPPALMPNPPTDANYFGPPTPRGPPPLDGPQDLPRVVWVKTPVEDHPIADPLEDGAQQWTTFPPSAETEITTTTTTMPDPHLKLKIHRTIPTMHWPGRVNSTSRSPNPSLAVTLGSGKSS